MRFVLLVLAFLCADSAAFAQTPGGPPVNGVTVQLPPDCKLYHVDGLAVNVAITATIPLPPRSGFTTVLCGFDWTVTEDTTGSAQANVSWTATNLNVNPVGGTAISQYSIAATPSAVVSGAYYPGFLIRAVSPALPITISSPAAATHAQYSLNVYFTYKPVTP